MKLSQKGRSAPPPPLPARAREVADAVAAWPDVVARAHWLLGDETVVDGADFYVGEDEIGHIHLDGEAHIAVSRPLRDALVRAGLATPFRWSADFVVVRVVSRAKADVAARIFRISYDRLRGVPLSALLARLDHPIAAHGAAGR